MPEWSLLIVAGVILIILGFFIVALGMMHESARREKQDTGGEENTGHEKKINGKVKGGGVILVGPIPIVFGTDRRYALILMVLAIIIMLLAIVFLK